MKIAVLSDIHGNLPALAAVLDDVERWGADELIVNGDLVNRGPYSLACLELLTMRAPQARLLKGNHEDFVLYAADKPPDPQDPTRELRKLADWTYAQMGGTVDVLRGWQNELELTGLDGGSSVHVTHGSRLGNRSGIHPDTRDEELPAKLGDPRDLFIVSHTHKPLTRLFNGTLVVNTGSVGQPMDGDPRAAYGRFTFRRGQWYAEIIRVAYDKVRAEQDCIDSGFLAGAGPLARLIHYELKTSQPYVAPWRRRYLDAVEAAQLSVAEAVKRYLDEIG